MFNRLRIKWKLLTIILVLTLIPLILVSTLSYQSANEALTAKSFEQLVSLREVKKGQIESYFTERVGDIKFLSHSIEVKDGLLAFDKAYQTSGPRGAEYGSAESAFGVLLTEYMNLYGYYDIFLINPSGEVVYTVTKEADFATNLVSGPYNDSGLATAFKEGATEVSLIDFTYYEPSGEPAAFLGAPVIDESGNFEGVLAFQLSLAQINGVMQERSGLGDSGETYLVGSDLLMRSDSRFSNAGESTVLTRTIDTAGARQALSGQSSAEIIEDYRQTQVFCAYAPLNINGLDWVILAEIDVAEVNAPVIAMRNLAMLIAGIVSAIVIGISLYFAGLIANPISKMTVAAQALAVGNVDVDVKVKNQDEIGQLSDSFKLMVDNIQEQSKAIKMVADGDLSFDLEAKSEADQISLSLNEVRMKVEGFIEQSIQLSETIERGQLTQRLDSTGFNGCWGQLLDNVNHLSDILEGHIRKVPAIMMAVDTDFNVQYMNDAALETVGKNMNQALGSKCYDLFKTEECGTDRCVCARAIKDGVNSKSQTIARPNGAELEIDYEGMPIKDSNGKILGAIELVVDQTEIRKAARVQKKQAEFQSNEVRKLISNLDDLANGKLEIYTSVAEADHDTKQISDNFDNIYSSLTDMVSSIRSYITEASDVLSQMSKKNLDLEISREYKGDFVEMKESINEIVGSFNEMLTEINNAAMQVAGGASQVSQSAQELSQGSTEQASSIDEITASMARISEQTRTNAENANTANALSQEVESNATVGNEQMKEMLGAMTEINDASSSIANIIKVIDEIAFQTNILALNAAVEAARAGEHGKGFAVVAEEVRNLAARSANAAKETTVLIEDSIEKVQAGTEIARKTSSALDSIVTGIADATNLVSNIADASNDQAAAITQIDEGIHQVSIVTQGNAATSEESAAASEEMTAQAESLQDLIGSFNLKQINTSTIGMHERSAPERRVKKKSKRKEMEVMNIHLDDEDFGKY